MRDEMLGRNERDAFKKICGAFGEGVIDDRKSQR